MIDSRNYPNYARPYRGLPAEIRMMIWKNLDPLTINVTAKYHRRLRRETYQLEVYGDDSKYRCLKHEPTVSVSSPHELDADKTCHLSQLVIIWPSISADCNA